jgi:hypothetical protein
MPKEEQSQRRATVVVITNSQPRATKSTSAELYRCKRKAEGEIGSQQPAWIQTNMQAVVVVTKSQPRATKSTSAELYRCKRKAEGEIGSQPPAWIQTMTVSRNPLSMDK